MLRVADIHFTYPKGPEVIRGMSFDVKSHEILGILGPNGSGKTTLLNLMLGLLTPNSGHIQLGNSALASLSYQEKAQQIAHVPQTDGISLNYRVWDIVMMGRQPYQKIFGFDSTEDCRQAQAAIAATQISALQNRPIQTLSGGERRRVMIARALAQDTPLMLLDEPTAHLDIHYQLEIAALLANLRDQRDRSIIMTLHDINLASLYCDRILLLSEGRVHALGTPRELITPEMIEEVFSARVAVEHDDQGRPYYRPLRIEP